MSRYGRGSRGFESLHRHCGCSIKVMRWFVVPVKRERYPPVTPTNKGNIMQTTLVVTCALFRGWYNMDIEEGLLDIHFNMRTGKPCKPLDDDWVVSQVPYREDWNTVK